MKRLACIVAVSLFSVSLLTGWDVLRPPPQVLKSKNGSAAANGWTYRSAPLFTLSPLYSLVSECEACDALRSPAMQRHVLVVALALAACGDGGGTRGAHSPSSGSPSAAKGSDGDVEEKVVVEKMPDGSIKKTTIRTTKRVVEAPPPPPRPEDPYPSDPLVRYNVEQINRYRSAKGLGPVLYDAKISAFARQGSDRLSKDHSPHAHFAAHAQGAPGFGSRSAENQGDPAGVPVLDPSDTTKNGKKQIDIMLKLMMDEGPGGGHHDNMMNPRFRRVGIGLVYSGGKLYLTNDFSD